MVTTWTQHLLVLVLALVADVYAATTELPSTFPHVYPGQPSGDYSVAWQKYFEVTHKLPNVTFDTGRSFAGNIGVQRAGHPNNTLFFLAYEKSRGSLTAPTGADPHLPWGIWLNGGPGSPSGFGAFFENGPIRINSDYSISENRYSWNRLSDFFWIDQPVGVGFSTADADGYVADEDQVGADFMGFLENLVKVFPNLAKRPLYLIGESYAGTYIPYITKAYFGLPNPPVKLAKIAIGDGTMTTEQVFSLLPALSVIETYPQLIDYDKEVYKYFKEQSHLCQYDVNLTYPQQGIIPSVPLIAPTSRGVPGFLRTTFSRHVLRAVLAKRYSAQTRQLFGRRATQSCGSSSQDFFAGRRRDALDPWYGCYLFDMMLDYSMNHTFPYCLSKDTDSVWNYYDVTDATNPFINQDASVFLNDPRVRDAMHAPHSKQWDLGFSFVFGNPDGINFDPSPEPMNFLTELATNASARDVGVVFYSGNRDALVPHRGTEIAIQNTTFGGIQGFKIKPSTPWHNDKGEFAGIIHQERNWTYALFSDAGHIVPQDRPLSALTFLREFVLGKNRTGSVVETETGTVVVGGTDPTLAGDNLPRYDDPIFYGPGAKVSSYLFPSATRAAWKKFIRTETALPSPTKSHR